MYLITARRVLPRAEWKEGRGVKPTFVGPLVKLGIPRLLFPG